MCDPVEELHVESIDPLLHHAPLVTAQGPCRGEEIGALAALVGDEVQSEGPVQLLQIELADEHADRAGDGRRQRVDLVRRDGDVVTAGRGDVAHAHNDRLSLLLGAHQLAPDQVRGVAVSARRVDPHDDRLDGGVVGQPVDAFRNRVRTGHFGH